ncbi:hypothetical protein JTB14_023190 [Gonioctena quinquepunctata]|nr:hypothetical protein JTB14_023190 [Gonioctena quinquepunctata]
MESKRIKPKGRKSLSTTSNPIPRWPPSRVHQFPNTAGGLFLGVLQYSLPSMRMGSTTGSSATPSTPAGPKTGFTPPPLQAGSSLVSATPVPTGSNLGNPEQLKPGSASLVTATLGDRLRSSNVADFTRTFEKMKVKTNVRGSDKRRRKKARPAAASAGLTQLSTSTGSEKRVGEPNTRQ